MIYLLIKTIHIVAVISWMAALLYWPRIMIYLHTTAVGSAESELLKTMGQRLRKFIALPAMLLTWAAGLLLLGYHVQPVAPYLPVWLLFKLCFVVALTGFHVQMGKWFQACVADQRLHYSSRTMKWLNELPAILMIAIVSLVVFRWGALA